MSQTRAFRGNRKVLQNDGDLPHYFDIILFAMVAAFLVLRLRSVLGRRTGNEPRRDPLLRRAEAPVENIADKVVSLGSRSAAVRPPVATEPPADAVAAGLERIGSVDPGSILRNSSREPGPPSK